MTAHVFVYGTKGKILGSTTVTLYAMKPGELSPLNGQMRLMLVRSGKIDRLVAHLDELNMDIPLTPHSSLQGLSVSEGGNLTLECNPLIALAHTGPIKREEK